MPASRANESSSSMLYVLIVFIVLFLAATVFAVVMFINNEDLKKNADTAKAELAEFGTSSELREAKPMGQGGGTVLSRIKADMSYMAGLVGGQDMGNLAITEFKVATEKRAENLLNENLPLQVENPELVEASRGLVSIAESILEEKNKWFGLYLEAETDKENYNDMLKQKNSDIEQELAQLKTELSDATDNLKAIDGLHKQEISDLTRRYEQQIEAITQQKDELQTERDDLVKQNSVLREDITKYDTKMKEMEKLVQTVRPNPKVKIGALEPDGYVVTVNTRDKLAYINLAKNDHVYRGLTFSVYDSYQEVPEDGKGKGTLEIIEIMDSISKCRIKDFDPTDPIMAKDVIVNMIWAKDKKYQFCVIGDFDYDGDGEVDKDGYAKVTNLVNVWGGAVVDRVSVDTDFLVIGKRPAVLGRPSDDELDRNSEDAQAYRETATRATRYDEVIDTADSLGTPRFNTTRFYRFIGHDIESDN